MAGAWSLKSIKDGLGSLFSARFWDVDGSGTSGFEVGHVLDPDPLSGWELAAASATDQAMGATGAAGDYIAGLLIVPETTSPGHVQLKDGSGSAIDIFVGGANSVSNLWPIYVALGMKSVSGAWKVTTGANVHAIGVGRFT